MRPLRGLQEIRVATREDEIYTVLSKYAHKLSQAPKPKVEVIILKEPKSVPLTDLSFRKKK